MRLRTWHCLLMGPMLMVAGIAVTSPLLTFTGYGLAMYWFGIVLERLDRQQAKPVCRVCADENLSVALYSDEVRDLALIDDRLAARDVVGARFLLERLLDDIEPDWRGMR
ncbi:hypothetical protein [Filomicrobium sp.]|uniref:hypothetical protein n=1 Tax=Filomicrobium sp. TaxID=2024831 RepID=UPI00258511CB|nr:hypothetical protein [Filomicrobium sp.]MCV0371099.1 hypothetical protein [Filomicrobium sp.]